MLTILYGYIMVKLVTIALAEEETPSSWAGRNMTLAPLTNAAMPIPLHAIAAMLAVAIGAAQLWLAKGTSRHRKLGYVWAGLIAFVAVSGFFIHDTDVSAPFNQLSKPLSVLVLVMLWWGIRLARAGKSKDHRQTWSGCSG